LNFKRKQHLFTGTPKTLLEKSGNHDGYDPIFFKPEEYQETLAQTIIDKNKSANRGASNY
jgi:inosine/xanthosine triphosphate pyrophosphatase family protein